MALTGKESQPISDRIRNIRFETIQYNRNMADDSYKDPSSVDTTAEKEAMYIRVV